MKQFEPTWYQKYYRLLAVLKDNKYSKLTRTNLQYHHVRPVSLFGQENNLVVCVPVNFHTRLHYLLWKHYEENGYEDAARKMKYAYEQLNSKFGCVLIDERYIKPNWKTYKYLLSRYRIAPEAPR